MSKNYGVSYQGHNSVYEEKYLENNYKRRRVNTKFSIPKNGVNKETGILLFIAGYGANSNSNVYKKIRSEFADKYNLVTIQCDYFGSEFMQSKIKDFNVIKEDNKEVIIQSSLNETLENFNDMGVMQVIDNIMVTLKVIKYLKRKKFKFNANKIMIMGNSHGSYLGYLCNAMCPGLYTHILDNSAWVYPEYCSANRVIMMSKENLDIKVLYIYKVKNMKSEIIGLRLRTIYRSLDNKCKIVVYHGADDTLISVEDKYNEIKNIKNVDINIITKDKIDGVIFKSTEHGLDADFLKLFDKFHKEYCMNIELRGDINIDDTVNIPGGYFIDYTSGIPIIINIKS